MSAHPTSTKGEGSDVHPARTEDRGTPSQDRGGPYSGAASGTVARRQGDRQGGMLRLEYPSGVTFRWQIVESTPDRVTWKCIEGPGNSVDTQATFELSDAGSGRTGVLFEHSGWTDSDPSFRKCNTLWGQLLHQLQQHL